MTCRSKSTLAIIGTDQAASLPRFWRCLEELAGDPDFEERLGREFARYASVWDLTSTDRRRFLQLMAASIALATVQGCSSPPPEPILPYVRPPEGMTPGVPLQFATAMPSPDGAMGLVVTSHMGRPTKVEGNPLHPASMGATDAWAQASVLTLYDPDRSQTVQHLSEISTWGAFLGAMRGAVDGVKGGAGIHVLSPPIWSPTLARQRIAFLAAHPQARWHFYEPVSRQHARRGAELAWGADLQPVYRFSDADIVLAVDSDFLIRGGGSVRYARDFMARRGVVGEGTANRLYVVETSFTSTGAAADHRLPLTPTAVDQFVRALAARLGIGGGPSGVAETGMDGRWLGAVTSDLQQHRGRSIVLAGEHQPANVHALVHAINDTLGNTGATMDYIAPIPVDDAENIAGLRELTAALNAGQVNLLLVLDGNPVYDAPIDLDFSAAIVKAHQSARFSLYEDETSALCHWHIPAAYYLESWSDARSFDGTAAVVQPLIAPLYDGKTIHEVVSAFVDPTPQSSYDLVRATWRQEFGDGFNRRWHAALREGVIAGSQFPITTPTLRSDVAGVLPSSSASAGSRDDGYELVLLPDPTIGDGRFANNGWLQELPKPLTKLTWENALLLAPATAKKHDLDTGDVVRLECNGQILTAPVCIVPGHPPGCLVCHFGYGRTRAGNTGTNLGFSAYRLRPADGSYIARGARLAKTDQRVDLARTQTHHAIDGRNIVHSATVAQFAADPASVLPDSAHHELPSLLPQDSHEGFAWGMAIDLSKCHGCNACVVACQAENNIPIVGQEEVRRSREMHWLRLDLYYSGSSDNPEAIHQPMLCQHCEKAPCEVVCPVAATTHSAEGLNEMTYNRCIGTRYCSNNCPYKVRRFNFFQYQDESTPVLKLLRNPDVTVRSRGVMEKCTYCVQRINRARIEAKKEAEDTGQPPTIADGTLQSACQQACPSEAIVFGNINDPQSRVAKLKADDRNYAVLSELGTQPRTSYLVRLRNLNPNLT